MLLIAAYIQRHNGRNDIIVFNSEIPVFFKVLDQVCEFSIHTILFLKLLIDFLTMVN